MLITREQGVNTVTTRISRQTRLTDDLTSVVRALCKPEGTPESQEVNNDTVFP